MPMTKNIGLIRSIPAISRYIVFKKLVVDLMKINAEGINDQNVSIMKSIKGMNASIVKIFKTN